MKHSLFLCCCFFLLLFLPGCYSYNKLGHKLNSNLGKSTTDLRMTFGPPTSIIDNSEAGQIWVYQRTYNVSRPGYVDIINGQGFYTLPSNHKSVRTLKFWVGRNNNVYRWESDGYKVKKISTWVWVVSLTGGAVGGFILGGI